MRGITKRLVALILMIAMVQPYIPASFITAKAAGNITEFSGGSGTASDPYLLSSSKDLNNVRNYLNAHFKMVNDIPFSETDFAAEGMFYNNANGWIPIGTATMPFQGVFDGDGYSISGIKVSVPEGNSYLENYAGIFGYTNSATIKNLTTSRGYVNAYKNSFALAYAGGIVGYSFCTILANCHNGNQVTGSNVETGGIVGAQWGGAITDCSNTGVVNAGEGYAGGIVGYLRDYADILNCKNHGNVHGGPSGGIIGFCAGDANVTNCYNCGSITGPYASDVGGIIGDDHYGATIQYCYNAGVITGYNAGGIVGTNGSPALVNQPERTIIENCYNIGNITANGAYSYAGGICGTRGDIKNCYNAGAVTAQNYTRKTTAPITAYDGYTTNSYSRNDQSYTVSDDATLRSLEDMKKQSTFLGFDFDETWDIADNKNCGFPYLQKVIAMDTFVDTTMLLHSTLYYDATDPYNDVYGDVDYLYQCYTEDFGSGLTSVMFVYNGVIIRDPDINRHLLMMYFAQKSKNDEIFLQKIKSAQCYIKIAETLKLNDVVNKVTGFAAESLGAIVATYLTGGVSKYSHIESIVKKQAIEELKETITDVARILTEAQLNYYFLTAIEMSMCLSEIEEIEDFTVFENCEKLFNCAEDLYRAIECAATLQIAVDEELEKTDHVIEVLGSLLVDVASGFVGEFGELLLLEEKISNIKRDGPDHYVRAVQFATKIASCKKTLDDYGVILAAEVGASFGDSTAIVEAYKARQNVVTEGFRLEKFNQIALNQHQKSENDNSCTDHNYRAAITPTTCTEMGYTTYTCQDCGKSYVADFLCATGHKYLVNIIAPTCTEDGYTTRMCRNCDYSYNTDLISATGHSCVVGICDFCNTTVGWNYTINDGAATITGYEGTDTAITIPSSINGYPVTGIGDHAFESYTNLTDVSIPDSVTSIGEYAFAYCSSLPSITLPNNVIRISESAFWGCSSLEYSIYENAKYLGNAENPYMALIGPTIGSLTTCKIHSQTKTIAEGAFLFYDCLKKIHIPDSVVYIGMNAFCYNQLEQVTLGSGVTYIGNGAFYGNHSLTSVAIPDSVTIIDNYAFGECIQLASVTIPNSVESIGEDVFKDCNSLTDIYYGGTAEQWSKICIGDNNTELTSATIHTIAPTTNGVTLTIGDQVTEYTSLQSALDHWQVGAVLTLMADVEDDLEVSNTIILDLNGYDILGDVSAAPGENIYVLDSQTDDYTINDEYGYGTIAGSSCVIPADGYAQITESGKASFHKVAATLESVTVRVNRAGIYYTGAYLYDEMAAQYVDTHGVVLSVVNQHPVADGSDSTCCYTSTTAASTLLTNIMSESNSDARNSENAQMDVYGRAYLKLTNGEIVYSDIATVNLKMLVEAIDEEQWDALSDQQQEALSELYTTYSTVMDSWNIPNLKGYATN